MPDPPRKPPPLPLAAHVGREQTLVKDFPRVPGAPGMRLPPMREKLPSLRDLDETRPSPEPPRELAPDPRSAREARTHGNRAAEEQDARQARRRSVSPAPWERDPEAVKEAVERQGDRYVEAPESGSVATPLPAPSRGAVRVQVGDVDVRVGSTVARRVLPWLAPLLLSAVGAAVGYAKGYFEGLAAAGRRVAAVEEAVRLNAEGDARHEKKTTLEMNRAFVVLDDHDERIPKLERQLGKVEQRTPKIEGLPKP